MSFHRRYFDWKTINSFANHNDFKNFNYWILKPESRIFEDDKSLSFVSLYISKKKYRKLLYDLLRSKYKINKIMLNIALNLHKYYKYKFLQYFKK